MDSDEVVKHERKLPNGLTARIYVPEGVSPDLECSFEKQLAASSPVTLEQAKLQAESKQAADKLERELKDLKDGVQETRQKAADDVDKARKSQSDQEKKEKDRIEALRKEIDDLTALLEK